MIVIPMAGLSSRFTKAGYTVPKYMLKLEDKTLFEHSVASFEQYFQSERFLFICRDVQNTPDFVKSECERLGIQDYYITVLTEPTRGQAETVYLGLQDAGISNIPITIFNIDTFRPGFEFPDIFSLDQIDGYLEVFPGEGDHWSFAKPIESDNEYRVAETTEKVRISDLCSTGLYYFKNSNVFCEIYEDQAKLSNDQLQAGELYIAPMYNKMIQSGQDIRYHLIQNDEVVFCGTPTEYEALLPT